MLASIISGMFAVAFGLVAANIEIRDNMDAFMSDLGRQGYWASLAATFAAVAAMLQAIDYFLTRILGLKKGKR
jgi:hypothetical protein